MLSASSSPQVTKGTLEIALFRLPVMVSIVEIEVKWPRSALQRRTGAGSGNEAGEFSIG